ncbi:MAG: hypothetical protein ACT4PV_00965 [Planctomycetaceae bacterium]
MGASAPRDPREGQEWFLRLPQEAREELRDAWRTQAEGERDLARRFRRTLGRTVLELCALFLFAELLLGAPPSAGSALAALAAGALTGVGCAFLRPGQFPMMVAVLPGHLLVRVLFGWGGVLSESCTLILLMPIAALLGLSHEMRRADGHG